MNEWKVLLLSDDNGWQESIRVMAREHVATISHRSGCASSWTDTELRPLSASELRAFGEMCIALADEMEGTR